MPAIDSSNTGSSDNIEEERETGSDGASISSMDPEGF